MASRRAGSPTICDLSNSPADKTIYAKKEESRSFHVIISGTVKIGRCSPDRREKLLAIRSLESDARSDDRPVATCVQMAADFTVRRRRDEAD